MQAELGRIKAASPGIEHKAAFAEAARRWWAHKAEGAPSEAAAEAAAEATAEAAAEAAALVASAAAAEAAAEATAVAAAAEAAAASPLRLPAVWPFGVGRVCGSPAVLALWTGQGLFSSAPPHACAVRLDRRESLLLPILCLPVEGG
jgi:hypothetical protein